MPRVRRPRPLPLPTSYRPGSDGKKRVLRRRARLWQPLFVPGDAGMDAELRVRVPVLDEYNHKIIGWEEMSEREYRKQNRPEPYWRPGRCEEESG